jgi:hypothetical protein
MLSPYQNTITLFLRCHLLTSEISHLIEKGAPFLCISFPWSAVFSGEIPELQMTGLLTLMVIRQIMQLLGITELF